MQVKELFRELSFGELSNLAISNEGSGEIIKEKHPKIIQYTNEALLKLFGRFVIREKTLLLEQVEHITNYHLRKAFAETSGSQEPFPYIKDLPGEPFEEDVVRILGVYDMAGSKYPLNDINDPASLFTPQPDMLQVPRPVQGKPMSIIYQARHRKLKSRGDHILAQEIEIPFFLEIALRNYVGYLVYSHMNGQENIVKGQEYLASYEATCREVEERDLVNQTFHTSHSKLEQRGFA
jgi:hypothetical protein